MKGVKHMSKFLKTTILLMSALAFFANPAVADGHKKAQMDRAGFDCFNAGPSNFMHCLRFEHFGNPAVPVNVLWPQKSLMVYTI
jgi:hypothetical protein